MLTYDEATTKVATQSVRAMYNAYMSGSNEYYNKAQTEPKARVLAMVYDVNFHEVHDALAILTHETWKLEK